ncbi:MAG TPA: energy transducer TonB [Acidobacteriaceae bacterium]|nr:energy transducer TonB [Acidobacteriaceae bacterium]
MAERNSKLECRGCGSTLEYDDTDPSSKCTYCGTVNEIPDGPKCEQCGGYLEYAPGTQTLKCQYCSTQLALIKNESELPVEADRIIPLTVDKKALLAAVEDYMVSGDFTPDDLIVKGKIATLELVYEPVYWFWGSFTANWTASFGYNRSEEYMAVKNEPYYVNGKKYYRQVNVMKTRTVTDWRPMSGVASDNFSLLGYAGDSDNEHVRSLIEDTPSIDDTEYSPDFLTSVPARPFLLPEDDVYSSRIKSVLNAQIDMAVEKCGQGDKQKDWNWSSSINKSSCSLLVPVCHAQFEYSGKIYNFWTDGRNVLRQSHDDLPVDWERQSTAAAINSRVSSASKRVYIPGLLALLAAFIGCPLIYFLSGIDLSAGFVSAYTLYNIGVVIAAFVFGHKRHAAIKTHWGYYVQDALSASRDRRKAALAKRRTGQSAEQGTYQGAESFTDDADDNVPSAARMDRVNRFVAITSLLVLALILFPLLAEVATDSSHSAPLAAQNAFNQSAESTTDSTQSTTQGATSTPSPPVTSATPAGLTITSLENMHYQIGDALSELGGRTSTVDLVDGKGSFGDWNAFLDKEHVAFGDLNGDGIDDAAVVLTFEGPGSAAPQVLVAVTNLNGNGESAAAKELGYNSVVKSINISGGIITVNMLTVGPNDSMADPETPQILELKLNGNRLLPTAEHPAVTGDAEFTSPQIAPQTTSDPHTAYSDAPGISNAQPVTLRQSLAAQTSQQSQQGGESSNPADMGNGSPLVGAVSGSRIAGRQPIYPAIAKAARIQGTVVLQATISRDGTIENLSVVSGPPLLQQAALDAVKTWRYRPFLLNGQPTQVQTKISVVFSLGP